MLEEVIFLEIENLLIPAYYIEYQSNNKTMENLFPR